MKKKGCLIVLLLVLALGLWVAFSIQQMLTPWKLADQDPRRMVKMFVCDPAFESMTDIRTAGGIAFAGGSALISFRIDPKDVDALIRRGRFKPVDDHAPVWVQRFSPESGERVAFRYMKEKKGMSESALFVSYGRDRCWFQEVQY